mgnify:CR=1 FL=1
MAPLDLTAALDLRMAIQNLRIEFVGDWHQDPWGWPELGFLLKNPSFVHSHVRNTGTAHQAAPIDVPKENWGVRPAVVLNILDRLTYQALVDRSSVPLIGDMTPNAFGWRLPPETPVAGVYSHNDKQWSGYRRHLERLTVFNTVALTTDIVSCFATIPVQSLQEAVYDRCPANAITRRLCDLLGRFASFPNRSGLPQRSFASAVLANMYLAPLDDVLLHFASPAPRSLGSGGVGYKSYARWMDDFWLFCKRPSTVRRAQVELQSAVRDMGLNLNSAKTEVFEGDDMTRMVMELEHSAVDGAIVEDDFGPLDELVDELIAHPESASRTSTRFACQRMKENEEFRRVNALLRVAARMPHVADHLSRLFKEAYEWRSLQDWFLEYADSEWATYEWSIAHFARMFPSSDTPKKALREYFIRIVRDANTSLPLLAVAAQRLAGWDKAEARAAFKDTFVRVSNPHARRVIAISALAAGERRTQVRRWLETDDDNAVTTQLLEGSSWQPLKVTKDYAR